MCSSDLQTVMVLPQQGITTSAGVATGVRRFVEAAGVPALLYIKHDGYIDPADAAALCRDGLISAIKYATVRNDPATDRYLRELVGLVDPALVISGIGEQPAAAHWKNFGIRAFTSGCVCVAPRRSQEMLRALQAGDFAAAEKIRERFNSLESLRNAHGPIPVLHQAVALAGIADTGPIFPLLAKLDGHLDAPIQAAATGLLAWNQG